MQQAWQRWQCGNGSSRLLHLARSLVARQPATDLLLGVRHETLRSLAHDSSAERRGSALMVSLALPRVLP